MRIGLLLILHLMLVVLPSNGKGMAPKGACLVCHKLRTPDLYQDWLASAHARNNVTCLDCHEAAPGEADAFAHGGSFVSLLVTPKDCAGCHAVESGQLQASVHAGAAVDPAKAGAWGDPTTCRNCHGSPGLLDARSPDRIRKGAWPDRGCGRVNPDGSKGSCSSCHADHAFNTRLAAQDKTCAACHTKGHATHHGALSGNGGPALDAGKGQSCLSCHQKHGHGASPRAAGPGK